MVILRLIFLAHTDKKKLSSPEWAGCGWFLCVGLEGILPLVIAGAKLNGNLEVVFSPLVNLVKQSVERKHTAIEEVGLYARSH